MGKSKNTGSRLGRALSREYFYFRRSLSIALKDLGRAVLFIGLVVSRTVRATGHRLKKRTGEPGRNRPAQYPYYRHTLPVRIMHWSNALFLVILFMSGLNIFEAHQALYWGHSSYRGVPPIFEIGARQNDKGEVSGFTRIFGHNFDTTGFLGVSQGAEGESTEQAFPSWLTIPDSRWLAMARRWHFFFAWLLVANGIAFVGYSIGSSHLRKDLLPTGRDVRSIGRSIIDHLRFHHESGEAAKHYNILQKGAYLGVIFFLLPLMILMGLGMSPALDALRPGWVDIFFGRQSMRTLHFVLALTLVLFAAVHIFEVIVTGLWNNLRSMITGYFKIDSRGGPNDD